jgi:nucleotide-binding universal stress UspA family protein
MAKRILVPLDQSPVAEAVVPLVADVARGAQATVRLMHVAPVPENLVSHEGRTVVYADQEMSRLEAEGLDYLRAVEVHFEGAAVDSVVRFGEPLKEILLEADAFDADMVAVTPSGKGGLSRALLGSVAEQVFRKAPMAVLLYRSPRAD